MRRKREEDRLWSRWPALAATLLIAAIFGLLSGVVKDAQFPRGVQSADKGTESPHLSKREPLRAVAASERKDATGAHATGAGGALVPRSIDIPLPVYAAAMAASPHAGSTAVLYWPGSLPRAPPQGA